MSVSTGKRLWADSLELRRLLAQWLFSRAAAPWWLLFGFLLAANAANVRFGVALNEWNGRFFNALQKVDAPAIYDALFDFIWLVTIIIVMLVLAEYAKSRLLLVLRRELTFRLIDRWLSAHGAHYLLRESGHEPDNPDQRIIEDARSLMSLLVNLSLSFLESVLTIGTFSIILWNLSGSVTVWGITIPGYMFWVCLSYTIIATVVTHWIGHPLKKLNFTGQHKEADLRYAFIEKRRHADAIAGAQGEERERANLKNRFMALYDVLVRLVKKQRDLNFFTVGLGQVTHLAPIFFALPSLLSGAIQLGGLMQIRGAFTDVARSFSWFIFVYDDLARLAATWERLSLLLHGLAAADRQRQENEQRLHPATTSPIAGQKEVLTAATEITLPQDSPAELPRRATFSLAAGPDSFTLVTGPSGVGKSTFLKTLAGFYANYQGHATLASSSCLYWVPQQPYLLKGTLRENLSYPLPPESFSDARYRELLTALHLINLVSRLNEEADWGNHLSGGEQQRILFLRVLLAQPDVLLLDETTSALDESAAIDVLKLLREQLPQTVIVMVSHQSTLTTIADRIVTAQSSTDNNIPATHNQEGQKNG